MDLEKSTLRIFRSLAKSNPRRAEVAERICKRLSIPFAKEKFKNIKVTTRDNGYTDEPVDCILINFTDHEIEISILDDRYFITKRFNDNEYQFVKQYLYEGNFLLEESFSLSADEDTFIAISECYPSSAVCVENEEKSIMRCHREDNYIDYIQRKVISMKSFISEITDKDEYLYQELIYFLDKESMYNINIRKSNNTNNTFIAGITTDKPKEMLNSEDLTEEEHRLFYNLGMIDNSPVTYPKMYFAGSYEDNGTVNTFEIHVLKIDKTIVVRIVDNNDKKNAIVNNTTKGAIKISELEFLKTNLTKILENRPYINWILDYFDEVIYRLNEKYTHSYTSLASYNKDIFDYMIIEGKNILGDISTNTIEKRAFDLYNRRSIIRNYLDDINLEPLVVKKEEVKKLK